ncbi:hypothetical protein BDZ94DRAFT_1259616 [Collybia nuda]|uniref:Uncharacterized protein n=1 Tax=Collybia nuda TaxID=64659 RepID=A0A9P6CJS5_9AGAR|nr:hypothetical protein BDZ94DRAFT_1259616 [Collybia nuda]
MAPDTNHQSRKHAQDYYLQFVLPYYVAARKAGTHKEFLVALYRIWFDRFPINNVNEDLNDWEWGLSVQKEEAVQQKFVARKLLLNWASKRITFKAPIDIWENIFNLEADRASRRAEYYQCRKLGIHLDDPQYLDTIENEADRAPIPVEDIINAWGDAVAIDANIFENP